MLDDQVKTLLDREDINPDQAGIACGRTPLSQGAGCGHEGIVKVLLECVHNAIPDNMNQTPLPLTLS